MAGGTAVPCALAAAVTARPRGCSLYCSAAAANRSTRVRSKPSAASTAVSSGRPDVSVPVLSKATTSTSARCSMATADFTSTPCRPALAIADSSGGMVASTTAHGDATNSKVMARSSAPRRSAPNSSGRVNRASVATTTITE